MDRDTKIRLVEKVTRGIEVSRFEEYVVNAFFPLAYIANLVGNTGYTSKEIFNQNVLGYKRLLKSKRKHGDELPQELRNMYLTAPCGIAKLCASTVRGL